MSDNAISKAKLETTALMCKSFYVDFMPILQKIQYNVSILNVFEEEKSRDYVINQINEQIDNAMSLLKQIKNFSENQKSVVSDASPSITYRD